MKNMKKTLTTIAIAAVVLSAVSCASVQRPPADAIALFDAVESAAETLARDIPAGTRAAVVAFESENEGLSAIIMEALSGALHGHGVEIADRRSLGFVLAELDLSMDGSVSDEAALSVGRFQAAQVVIAGSLFRVGAAAHRLDVRAIVVETSARASSPSFAVRDDGDLRGMLAAAPARPAPAAETGPPRSAGAFLDRGFLFFERRDFETALQEFTEAIRMDPNLASAYLMRGLTRYRRGDFTGAIADYTQAIRLDPDWAIAYNNRGLAHDGRGEFAQAISDFTQAIRLNPNFASAFSNRGNAHLSRSEFDSAFADYNQAIRLNPDHPDAHFNRGTAHLSRGEFGRAIADFTVAIRLNPNDHRAFVNRGNAHRDAGYLDLAIADYEAALRISPNSAMARQNLEAARRLRGL